MDKNSHRRPVGCKINLWLGGAVTLVDGEVIKINIFLLPWSPSHSLPPSKLQHLCSRKDFTDIVDSGASGLYFSKNAPVINFDLTATTVTVGTASCQPHQSSGAADLGLPNLPTCFPLSGKVVPSFKHTLIGLGPMWNANCKVFFTKGEVIIYDPTNSPILAGWQETEGARLWYIYLTPTPYNLPTMA